MKWFDSESGWHVEEWSIPANANKFLLKYNGIAVHAGGDHIAYYRYPDESLAAAAAALNEEFNYETTLDGNFDYTDKRGNTVRGVKAELNPRSGNFNLIISLPACPEVIFTDEDWP